MVRKNTCKMSSTIIIVPMSMKLSQSSLYNYFASKYLSYPVVSSLAQSTLTLNFHTPLTALIFPRFFRIISRKSQNLTLIRLLVKCITLELFRLLNFIKLFKLLFCYWFVAKYINVNRYVR